MGGNRTSFIHAKRFGKKFKCNFCGKGFPATTSVVRFRYHLAGIPGQGVHVCNNVPETIKQEAMDDVPEVLKEEDMGKGLSHNKKQKSGSASPNSNCTLSEISDGNCSNEVDTLLAMFLEINDIDCNIVESTSFLNLVQAICKYGPGNYVPPSSDTLRSKLIPLLRQEVEQSVATTRQSLKRTGFTAVPHVWCNEKEGKSFLSIIACSRKSAVLLNTFELPREKSFLEEFFRSALLDIGAENIVQCIVDVNVWAQLFGEFLTEECPHVSVTKCASVDIQSFFDSVCMEVEWIQAKFDAAQVIFDYACKNSDILELMMRKYSNGCKELKQLRGGYGVLDAVIEAKDELVKLAESPEWVADVYGRGENGHYLTQIIKNEEFWDQGKKLQMALKPLHQILYLDDIGDLGYDDLYSSMRRAEEAIGRLCTDNPNEYRKLWDIFESKRGQIVDGIHKATAFLNPQIMRGEMVKKSREMDEDIDYMLKRLVAADDKRAFVKQTLDYREILSNPSNCYMTIAAEEFPPCKWWAEFSKKFPILAKYAIRVLSQPCSSLSRKSSLSAFLANQIEQRRKRVGAGAEQVEFKDECILHRKVQHRKCIKAGQSRP